MFSLCQHSHAIFSINFHTIEPKLDKTTPKMGSTLKALLRTLSQESQRKKAGIRNTYQPQVIIKITLDNSVFFISKEVLNHKSLKLKILQQKIDKINDHIFIQNLSHFMVIQLTNNSAIQSIFLLYFCSNGNDDKPSMDDQTK